MKVCRVKFIAFARDFLEQTLEFLLNEVYGMTNNCAVISEVVT